MESDSDLLFSAGDPTRPGIVEAQVVHALPPAAPGPRAALPAPAVEAGKAPATGPSAPRDSGGTRANRPPQSPIPADVRSCRVNVRQKTKTRHQLVGRKLLIEIGLFPA